MSVKIIRIPNKEYDPGELKRFAKHVENNCGRCMKGIKCKWHYSSKKTVNPRCKICLAGRRCIYH